MEAHTQFKTYFPVILSDHCGHPHPPLPTLTNCSRERETSEHLKKRPTISKSNIISTFNQVDESIDTDYRKGHKVEVKQTSINQHFFKHLITFT